MKAAGTKINNAIVWKILERILSVDKDLLSQVPPKRLESVRSMLVGGAKNFFLRLGSLESILIKYENDKEAKMRLLEIWSCAVKLANRNNNNNNNNRKKKLPSQSDFIEAVEESKK